MAGQGVLGRGADQGLEGTDVGGLRGAARLEIDRHRAAHVGVVERVAAAAAGQGAEARGRLVDDKDVRVATAGEVFDVRELQAVEAAGFEAREIPAVRPVEAGQGVAAAAAEDLPAEPCLGRVEPEGVAAAAARKILEATEAGASHSAGVQVAEIPHHVDTGPEERVAGGGADEVREATEPGELRGELVPQIDRDRAAGRRVVQRVAAAAAGDDAKSVGGVLEQEAVVAAAAGEVLDFAEAGAVVQLRRLPIDGSKKPAFL